ncbi:MAG: DUF2891 domain-containing protein [Candidatus Krumholzibacteriota bacterium]|nr:DUF2891 domain-containing protein [Candidatus Krumholzibacteriota bacterium]
MALRCVRKEYPAKLSHVMNDRSEVKSPAQLHPAFNGCFDWHSCVHAHWMMTRLLRIFPELPEADSLRSVLGSTLTERNIEAEVRYLSQPGRKSFERMYGWAWLLKLSQELLECDDPAAESWSRNLQPLTDNIVERYLSFIPKQTYPIRRGVHANTAFGLTFALDYARAAGVSELEELIVSRSIDYFADDRRCPGSWEPGGDDFLSPCLIEADLMRRVFKRDEFREWFHNFLPELNKGYPENLLKPAVVSDRSDPKIVHLDGLNLSRAWCLYGIAKFLKEGDPARRIIFEAAELHSNDALSRVATGNYEGEHWLASFAVYMYSCAGGVNKR